MAKRFLKGSMDGVSAMHYHFKTCREECWGFFIKKIFTKGYISLLTILLELMIVYEMYLMNLISTYHCVIRNLFHMKCDYTTASILFRMNKIQLPSRILCFHIHILNVVDFNFIFSQSISFQIQEFFIKSRIWMKMALWMSAIQLFL